MLSVCSVFILLAHIGMQYQYLFKNKIFIIRSKFNFYGNIITYESLYQMFYSLECLCNTVLALV